MKILRTKNGNAIIASNIVYISQEIDYYTGDQKRFYIQAIDRQGKCYLLVDTLIEDDSNKKFQSILDYLTQEGEQHD